MCDDLGRQYLLRKWFPHASEGGRAVRQVALRRAPKGRCGGKGEILGLRSRKTD